MSGVNAALEKIRAVIGNDNEIIRHYIHNKDVVAVIGKKHVGNHTVSVSSCFHISITM